MNTATEAAHHQGGDLRGLRPHDGRDLLDVGTCVNVYGPHPAALRALAELGGDALRVHPYVTAGEFRNAYLRFLDEPEVHPGDVLVGAGITAFLRIFERMRLETATVWPDYTETIARFALAGGGRDSWEQRAARVEAALARYGMVVISNPVNPTGAVIPAHVLVEIAADHPGATLVVDEAYAEFQTGSIGRGVLGAPLPNIVVLRSPNKILGAAGLRVGMMWTRNAALRQRVAAELPRWPISAADGAAATAGLADTEHWDRDATGAARTWVASTRRELLGTAGWMDTALREQFGDAVLPSPLHFRFVAVPDPARLDQVWTHLHRHGIAVRVFTAEQPGRLAGLRFVAPTATDWPRLRQALKDVPPV